MSEDVFEGEKDVRTVKRNDDAEFFQRAMNKLKFERDVDLIVFCASIGLYRSKLKGIETKESYPSLRKLTSIMTLDSRRLFDYIVQSYLGVEKGRLKEFECYFYTGFKILEEWFDKNDKNVTGTLERFSTLNEDLLVEKR